MNISTRFEKRGEFASVTYGSSLGGTLEMEDLKLEEVQQVERIYSLFNHAAVVAGILFDSTFDMGDKETNINDFTFKLQTYKMFFEINKPQIREEIVTYVENSFEYLEDNLKALKDVQATLNN